MPVRGTVNPYGTVGSSPSAAVRGTVNPYARPSSSSASTPLSDIAHRVGGVGTGHEQPHKTIAEMMAEQARHSWGPGTLASPFVTPLNAVLAASLIPARAVGDVIAHPRHIVTGGPSISGLFGHQSAADLYKGKAPLPSQALRGRGLLPGGKLGAVTGFLADVGLDPTTFATGGLGAAARGAERVAADAAAAAAAKRIDEIAATRAPSLAEIADAHAAVGDALAKVPKTLKVGVAVPFTRGKEITLAETRAVHNLAHAIGEKLPQSARVAEKQVERGVATGRGIARPVHEIDRALERSAQHASNDLARSLRGLKVEIKKGAHAAKMKRWEAAEAITRHLDDPVNYPLPAGLEKATETATKIRDSFGEAEARAGIVYRRRQNYVPHIGKTPEDKRQINLWKAPPADAVNRLDKPFFINPRLTDTLDEFIAAGKVHGFEPELNIVQLLKVRGERSIMAQRKKALSDAVTGQWGAKAPEAALPSTAKQEARVADAQARLAELSAPVPTNGLRADAAAARQTVAESRAALDAAKKTGDISQVAAARDYLERTRALSDERLAVPTDVRGDVSDVEAHAALDRASKVADRRAAKAERRLAAAQKQGSKSEIARARAALSRAETTARHTRLAVERARGTYVGRPENIRAATKESIKADKALAAAERKRGVVELANEVLAAKPGRPTTPEEWADLRTRWTEIRGATKYHKGTLLPPDIAEALEAVHDDMTRLMNPSEVAKMGHFVKDLTSRWKSLALLSPGYQVRNLADDGVRAYMAGARSPRSFVQAARLLRGGEKAKITIGGKTWTAEQYLRRARAYGVIDTGQVRVDIGAGRGAELSQRGPGRGAIAQGAFAVGEARENMTRLGTFIELEKKGLSPLRAAEQTRRYLFDYGEVGRLTAAARSFFTPFITYTTKAIPFAVRELGRRPGRFATIGKTLVALNDASGNPDLSALPMYLSSSFPVPLPNAVKGLLGVPSDQPVLVNPRTFFGISQLDMLDPRLKQAEQNWTSTLNPLIQAPVEIGTGTNLFFRSRLPALAQAPGFVSWLAAHGVPVPTYTAPGQPYGIAKNGRAKIKYDSFTHQPVAGYSSYLDILAGLVPLYGQAGGLTRSGQQRLALARFGLGASLTPYDRARAEFQAQRHGGG